FPHRKWVRDLRAVPPRATALRLERVRPRYARAFATLAAEAFAGGLLPARDWYAACVGRPGWTHYVTYDGNTVAGCGAL
ncbi:hypothetical protein NL529_34010, partial [Klebsiella pneumoniae]|nr:hypothetical protein [Klebsiella pneumoniae]